MEYFVKRNDYFVFTKLICKNELMHFVFTKQTTAKKVSNVTYGGSVEQILDKIIFLSVCWKLQTHSIRHVVNYASSDYC